MKSFHFYVGSLFREISAQEEFRKQNPKRDVNEQTPRDGSGMSAARMAKVCMDKKGEKVV